MHEPILLVEDDQSHRKIYSSVLRAHGFRPIEIADPRTAFSAALKFDVVLALIDIMLPYVDGRVLVRALRGDPRTSAIPILAISASTEPDMAETCLSAGAHRFRVKPLPLHKLMADVRELAHGGDKRG